MATRLPLPPGAIPITPMQLAVLLAASEGPCTQVDIAERLDRHKCSIQPKVVALRAKGLLVDAPPQTNGAVATDLAVVRGVQLRGRCD